jgi:hypothetical protein
MALTMELVEPVPSLLNTCSANTFEPGYTPEVPNPLLLAQMVPVYSSNRADNQQTV